MHWLDWCIVLVPSLFVLFMAFYARKYARDVVDFLVAGRVAGRYLISVGDMAAALSVITLVSNAEIGYNRGFAVSFWGTILAPVGIVLALTGFITYRWRMTRCLSKGQFIEIRYGSKFFRFFTAFISTMSEMITNAIGPAIAANFFIFYLGLPHKITLWGVSLPIYGLLVGICILIATVIILPGGRISLLITDSIQGIFSYPIFVIIAGYIILNFGWSTDIAPVLEDRVAGQSFLNPYDIANLRDFNLFTVIVSLVSTVINRGAWIGNDISGAGKTPHEQKMAGVLGSWRNGFAMFTMLIIPMLTICFMSSGVFAKENRFGITNNQIRRQLCQQVVPLVESDPVKCAAIQKAVEKIPESHHTIGVDAPLSQTNNLDTPYFAEMSKVFGDTPAGRHQFQQFKTLFQQQMMPVLLKELFPIGLYGLFCLLMIMLLISTDDSRIFNAASCIMQDMILPFVKNGALSPKMHLFLLRLLTVVVAVLFFIIAVFFQHMDYIYMFSTIMCALWLGGSGPIMVFGLYSRFGNLTGAWCAMIFGSGTSLLGLIFQRNWALHIYPLLEKMGWVDKCDQLLRAASAPFEPWIHWEMSTEKFPINSFEIFFISMVLSIGTYILGSYLTYKPYDLDKLLHRGAYADGESDLEEEKTPWSVKKLMQQLVGITKEYSKGDRMIAWSVFIYSIIYQLGISFVAVIIWNMISPWPNHWWTIYYYITALFVPVIIGIISTVWFLWGSTIDLRQLFKDLAKRKSDLSDNGQVFDAPKTDL